MTSQGLVDMLPGGWRVYVPVVCVGLIPISPGMIRSVSCRRVVRAKLFEILLDKFGATRI